MMAALMSSHLMIRLKSCEIDKGSRVLAKPSDHTPIVLILD
jgi:exonuclease III